MSWLKIIKKVKSSDLEEITAAYEKALPFVVQDWATMILNMPRNQRKYMIEKIARLHGDQVGEMLKTKIFVQHAAK